jgi:hypothetical protein
MQNLIRVPAHRLCALLYAVSRLPCFMPPTGKLHQMMGCAE